MRPGTVVLCSSLSILSACSSLSPRQLAQPSDLTIQSAMRSIGEGFAKLEKELSTSKNKLGLWPCKVTAVFNVTANAKQKNELVLNTSVTPPTKVVNAKISANDTLTNGSTASRGNTVDIELYSAACVPKGTVGYDKPDKVGHLVNALSKASKLSVLGYTPHGYTKHKSKHK